MEAKVKVFHWLPRIVCIIAILFVSMFALDSFAPGLTIWQQLGAFFIHLIPSVVLILFLIVAWKRELIGGIIFILTGFILTPFVYSMNYNRTHSIGISVSVIMMITFPFIVVGILFLRSNYLKKRNLGLNNLS